MALPAALRALALARKQGPLRVAGRFATAQQWLDNRFPDYQRKVEAYLREQLGSPPGGNDWVSIAGKYTERFSDFLQDVQ